MPRRVVYVTTYDPDLGRLGGAAYIDSRQIAGLRSAGLEVEVVSVTGGGVPLEIRRSPLALARTGARMVVHGEPYSLAKFKANWHWHRRATELRRAVDHEVSVVTSQTPALALAHEVGIAPDVHIVHNVDTVIAETHDPLPLRILGNSGLTRQHEAKLLNHAQRLLTLSTADRDRLQAWRLTPPSAAMDLLLAGRGHRVSGRQAIGFIGKLSWPPNRTALNVLLDDVMPHVRTEMGASSPTVVVAGRGSESVAADGVRSLGEIRDVGAFYDAIDLVVVPRLSVSTGVSVKLLEACAYGVQAIAPRALLESAGVDDRCITADTPSEIASAVCTHYGAPGAPAVSRRGHGGRITLARALGARDGGVAWAS